MKLVLGWEGVKEVSVDSIQQEVWMCDAGAMGAMERILVISALLQLCLGTKRQGVGEGNVLSFCSYLLLIVAKL